MVHLTPKKVCAFLKIYCVKKLFPLKKNHLKTVEYVLHFFNKQGFNNYCLQVFIEHKVVFAESGKYLRADRILS